MIDCVLVKVHRAWHGAWCWRRVAQALWQAGDRAFAAWLSASGCKPSRAGRCMTWPGHDAMISAPGARLDLLLPRPGVAR